MYGQAIGSLQPTRLRPAGRAVERGIPTLGREEIDSEEYVDMGWKDKGNIQDIEDIKIGRAHV